MKNRRLFLGRLGAGLGVMGAVAIPAAAQSGGSGFQPARHDQDDWLDQIPGKHRFIFDTTSPGGFSWGLIYATNYMEANKSSYGLTDADLAVVIVARHKSTPYGYNDAIWTKYGASLTQQTDNAARPAGLPAMLQRGVHLAVCQMATRQIAGVLARATSGNADDIFKELGANLVSNAHFVPAGIVAVNRAQEHGYTFVTAS